MLLPVREKHELQMRKGVLEIAVLKLLSIKPGYGYELITIIQNKSNNTVLLRDGTLYPILYRLEDEGLLASECLERKERAKPKKIYSVTENCMEKLKEPQEIRASFSGFVDSILKQDES